MADSPDPKPAGRQPSPHDVPPRTIALIVGVMLAGLIAGMLLIMPHYGPRQPRRRSALGHVAPISMIGIETNGMMWVPGGTFVMGSTLKLPDAPAHEVSVAPFWMDKTEVTVAQFNKFLESSGRSRLTGELNLPATNVTWDDAAAYASWAGKRLPTEAEWEYAARGGLHQLPFISGETSPGTNQANISASASVPAGSYPPNGYGLHDMDGNVAEWCGDWYDAAYYQHSPKLNPPGPSQSPTGERVIRGGSFLSAGNAVENFRPGTRSKARPERARPDLGFRCIKPALPN